MENQENKKVTDLTYLKQISKGDTNFINEMIAVYIQQTPEAISNLEKHLADKEWQKFRAVTHKMKPSFSFFGLTELYETVDFMEEYSEKEIHLERLPAMVAKVKLTCEKAVTELKIEKNISATA